MARQQSQNEFGNQYFGQPNVNDFDQDQPDDKHARALSYVRDQVRAQLGGQVPAWDGPIPGFWNRAKNQQYQDATANYGQGQPMHDTTRAQFQAQEQFRGPQQGDNRANWKVPAQGMQQMSSPFGHQHPQNGMPGPNTEQGQPATTGMQQMRPQNRMSGPDLKQGQPAAPAQGRN